MLPLDRGTRESSYGSFLQNQVMGVACAWSERCGIRVVVEQILDGVDFDDSSKDYGVLDGALGGLGDCGVVTGDGEFEYVPRFRDVEGYIKTGVSLVESHMMEQMTSKGKGVVIEEIVDNDVDAVGKEFDGESGNSGKLLLLKWNQSSQVGKDGTVVDNDFCDFDSGNEFPPPWSAEIMITNRTKG
ncbi:hypothetical protein Tco_0875117 [Tanacetum coccineum]|uniref:Uncharacterized protein n=1 Tax=Tanacetum coccineum TaxID=301880 RepID=A0ABQ5BRL0_9ASTR